MKNENNILAFVFIFLIFLGYFGWFMAEQDNQLLQQELISLKYNSSEMKEIHE